MNIYGAIPHALSQDVDEFCHGDDELKQRLSIFFYFLCQKVNVHSSRKMANPHRYHPFNRKQIRTIFGDKYYHLISYDKTTTGPYNTSAIERHGLIETEEHVFFGKGDERNRLRGYRLPEKCFSKPQDVFNSTVSVFYKKIPITSKVVNNAYNKYKSLTTHNMKAQFPHQLKKVIDYQFDGGVTLNFTDVKKYLKKASKKEDVSHLEVHAKCFNDVESLTALQQHAGRLTTPFTNLSSKMLPFLRFKTSKDGQRSYLGTEIDYKTCQMSIVSCITPHLLQRCFKQPVNDFCKTVRFDTDDWSQLRQLCLSEGNDFYEYFAAQLEQDWGEKWRNTLWSDYRARDKDISNISVMSERGAAKTVIIADILFGSVPKMDTMAIETFRRLFPNVYDFVVKLKRSDLRNNFRQPAAYKNLAWCMQSIESLIVNTVMVELVDDGIYQFVPRYDSLICLPWHDTAVKQKMTECSKMILGAPLQIKEKNFNDI